MFARKVLENGGIVRPLLVPHQNLNGPSLCNPSVLNKEGEIIINLRNINYVLHHSEQGKYEHSWGPLCYLHGENDQRLFTKNIFCTLNENLEVVKFDTIDTFLFDQNPLWEFVGLEDGRLVNWNNEIYLSGVRRDTTTNGQGRMELSKISQKNNKVFETERKRIPAPPPDTSYCEKNWMPVLNQPFTYVKWTNPTEVVKFDVETGSCDTIFLSDHKPFHTKDLRGGSQVLPLGDKYLAVVHEVDLFNSEAGRKNAVYLHRFVLWDQRFNLIDVSDSFSFMGGKIEFCCGIAEKNENLIITFGFQDNAAFIASFPKKMLSLFLKEAI
jgi:hypothetical protein